MFGRTEKTVEELRKELIDDCYAAAFAGGIGPALLEISDIERMSDEEIVDEAKRRGWHNRS